VQLLREEPASGEEADRRPGVYICDECIDLCNEIINEEFTAPPSLDLDNLPKPKQIYSVLSDYVIGQEEAKRPGGGRLQPLQAGAHGRAREGGRRAAEVDILLLGPDRVRQDLLAQTLARILNVPFAIADATALTEAAT